MREYAMILDALLALTPGERQPGGSPLRDFLVGLPGSTPMERAVFAGWTTDRVGYAFLAGYRAALASLLPRPAEALAVTERGGNHPRAIEATVREADGGWRLQGSKMWCTGADSVDTLVVIAVLGEPDADQRKNLRALYVPAEAVELEPMAPMPFVPEIGHSHVHLRGVWLPESAMLEGDAWHTVVKPFRTVEDIHVMAAVAAHGAGVALLAGRQGLVERGLAFVSALTALSTGDPLSSATHLALGGVAIDLESWFLSVCAEASPSRREDLTRDSALLKVARGQRTLRRTRAWDAVTALGESR